MTNRPTRQHSTENQALTVAVLAKCRGLIRAEDVTGVVPDPFNPRITRYTLHYEDDEVGAAIDAYPNFSVEVQDYEAALQLVTAVRLAARRRAQAPQPTAFTAMQNVIAEAERR